VAKTALADGTAIAEAAHMLGLMGRSELQALLVVERLTQPTRLSVPDASTEDGNQAKPS